MVKKQSTTQKKTTVRKTVKKTASNKVDYYPNRMTVAVAALAGTSIVLFALLAVTSYQ